MFVKLCGFTRHEDVEFIADLPISAIGFIFYKKSKRYISPQRAAELSKVAGSNILKIGVFVEDTTDEIKAMAEIANLDMLQLYNSHSARELKGFLPIIQCLRVKEAIPHELTSQLFGDFILVDTFDEKNFGGTGKSFNPEILKNFPLREKLIVAGGINCENVSHIIKEITPFGIDISSGIEISPGIKSKEKIITLLQKIKEAENDQLTR